MDKEPRSPKKLFCQISVREEDTPGEGEKESMKSSPEREGRRGIGKIRRESITILFEKR